METKFIPVDYDYFDFNGRNYIKIIGRNDKNKRICLIDSFEPYFWVILKPKVSEKKIKEIREKISKLEIEKQGRMSNVLKTEIHEKNFLGNKVKAIKIFITNYKDAHDFADKLDFKEIDKRRGYDLGFVTAYIIERKLKPLHWYSLKGEILHNEELGGIAESLDVDYCIKPDSFEEISKQDFNPKILAYDIETDEFEIGKGHILMISLYGENFKKVLTWKSNGQDFVENFKDEEEMLEAFVKYIKEYSPDILVGYFSDGFDLPYIKERASKIKVKLNLGLDNSVPRFSRGALLTGRINGIVHIDILRFIRNAYSQYLQSETLSLNDVASELLDEKKTEFNAFEAMKSSKINWKEFYAYNLQDSKLTLNLTKKIWPDLLEITRITNEPLFETSRSTMAGNFEDLVIHNLGRFNEIPEKKPHSEEIGKRRRQERYEGAFVFQPIPGLYENIGFFDFTSMYASVIVSYNLSRSTQLEKKEKNSFEGDYNGKKVYFSKKQGFFPLLLSEIIDKRKKYKEEYKKNPNPILKARSNAFKLIANAAYGYQGFFGARYYSIEAAASTAYFARENIKKAISGFEKEGFIVRYSDTDSVAIELGQKSEKQAIETLKKINSKLPGIMELDLEGFFKRGIWVTKRTGDFGAKKKYALIDKNDRIKIRGFETVRRDWCDLARTTQNKILELILKEGNEKSSVEFLKKIIKKIKSRDVELKQLIIKTQLKKPIEEYKSEGPHVTIAKKMKALGIPTDIGMLIEYYVSESDKKRALVRERAKLPNEPGKYDIDYYLRHQILPAVENILEVFNVNTKELLDGRKQMKLGEF